MLPKLTRSQKILAAVAALIVALYVTGVATQDGSETSDPSQHGLVKALGNWFGSPDPVALDEMSAPCLKDNLLTIESACVVTIHSSTKDLRSLLLVPDKPLHVKSKAPHDDALVDKDVEAHEEIKVAVDGDGVDVTLTCGGCTVKVGD